MTPLKNFPGWACAMYALILSVASGAAVTPELGTPAAQTTSRNGTLVFSSTNGNAITITNAGAGTNKLELTLSVTQGTATLRGTSGLTFTRGDGTNDSVMTFRGTSTNINAALRGLVFTPSNNYFGPAALTLMTPAVEFAALNVDGALAGRYSFDNTSALGQDTSPGGTQSGTVSNATTAADIERGAVLDLDALDGADYLQVSGRFGDPANVTLAAWVNLFSADSLGSEVITLGDRVSLVLDSSGNLVGSFFSGLTYRTVSFPTILAGSGWHHVAYTMDDAGDAQRLYLDGVQVASGAETASISYFLAANTTIGKHPVLSTVDFTGNIDEARVYTRVLSAPEIAVLANDLSARTTNSVSITVIAPPVIASQPVSQWGGEGSNVALTVTATGTAPLNYRWAYNGTNISGATNSTLDLTSIALSAGGNYTVVVTNSFGSVTSQVAVLTVLSIPPLAASQDTHIENSESTLNYGAATSHTVDTSGPGIGNQRVLLQFDLSAIPAGARILNASLRLQATAVGGSLNVRVYRITEPWVEGNGLGTVGAASWNQRVPGTNWTTAGVSYDPTIFATLNTSAVGLHSWDVTTLVQGWVGATMPNNGILLASADTGSKTVTYDSREGTTPPELRVSFAVAPAITAQPESQTVDAGNNVSFTVTATGTAPLFYQWRSNSVIVAGATNSSLNLSNLSLSASGNYEVVITNAGGSVTSLVAALTVQAVPLSITAQPVSQTVVEGTNVTFTVTAIGTAPLSYQWARNGSNIVGATNSILNLTNISLSAGGDITVLILNSGGFVASVAATLTVLPAPPGVTTQPVSRTVSEGTNVSFTVVATGTAPLSYQWYVNAVPIAGATSASFSLTNVAMSASGDYAVIVTNVAGSITSQVAVLTVLAVPPTIITQPVNLTVNDGDDASFSVTATGTAPLSYQWEWNSMACAGATNAVLILTNVPWARRGDYRVVVTNSAGSVTSQVARLGVLPVPPTITVQPASQSATAGSTVILSVTATGTPTLQYKWLRNGVTMTGEEFSSLTLFNVQASEAGTYRVVVFNAQGTVSSADAQLAVTIPPLAMTDDFSLEIGSTNFTGIGQSSNTVATIEVGEPEHVGKLGGRSMWFTWQAPDTGIVTFSTAGSDFDTLLAAYQGDSVNALVLLTSDDDSAGFYNSQVQFNVVSNTVYHVAVDGAGTASGNIVLQWTLEPTSDVLPVITNQPVDRIVSLTSNAVFTVGVSGAGVAYQWFFNDVAVPDGTNSTWIQAGVGLGDVGLFKVQATIGARTVTSQSASLGITLSPGLEQEFSAADKFSDTISSGRRLRLDPPPAASFLRLPPDVAATSRGYSGSQVFSTVGSLKEPGEPDHCGVHGGASRWFAFEAETDGVLDLNTDGSTFDTLLAVYTGTNANFSELTVVACDNDSGTNGVTSSLHFTTVTGTIYYIAVDGVNGASGTVVLNYTTLGEQVRPSITITSAPPVNVGLTNGDVTIGGVASDNTELSAVEWRVTNTLGVTEWTLASGSNSWTFTAGELAFGNNTVQIRSLDSWGNVSAITSRIYLRLAPVTVTVDGCGSVSSGFLGTTYREPGKSFSIVATPCAGFLFAGWTGDWVTNRNAITLVAQTGLVVQVNFVTNQFAMRIGNYAGLFYDTNSAAHESSGFVTARTTAKGTYSGRLRIGTRSHSFSGSFGLDGLATNSVRRGGTNLPLRLELNFNLNQLVQSVTGRVVDTNWSADLAAFRAAFHSRTNPAVYQGRYTLLFAANGEPGTPDGDGYGVATVSPNGSLRLKGGLGDGASISQGTFVSREGLWPFYLPLRSGRGSISSWLAFETNEVAFGTNVVQSDIMGDARWFTPTLSTARYYPGGFTNALNVAGSRYAAPVSSTNGALTFSNGVVAFQGGNLSAPFTNEVLRAVDDRVTDEGTNKLSLKITRSSGLMSGSVAVPFSGQKVSFKGALFQNGNFGSGYFLHTNRGGAVWFGPRE